MRGPCAGHIEGTCHHDHLRNVEKYRDANDQVRRQASVTVQVSVRSDKNPAYRPAQAATYAQWVISTEGSLVGAEAANRLARIGRYEIGPGLTDAEFSRIEQVYEFEFADDHRAFLAAGLPLNSQPPEEGKTWRKPWPEWRDGDPDELRARLDRPVQGALFDVEYNALWHSTWGCRPDDPDEALEMARQHLLQVPKMIPIYGHRYLPAGRGIYGHPVLSIHQTDIIFYGTDLPDYIDQEFSRSRWFIDENWTPPPLVSFWRDFL